MVAEGLINGRLTQDVKIFDNGGGVITVAVKKSYKNKENEYETNFFSVFLSKKTAPLVEKNFKKGDGIMFRYTLDTRKTVDSEGKTKTEIILYMDNLFFGTVGKKFDGDSAERPAASAKAAPKAVPNAAPKTAPAPGDDEAEILDDDELPF